MDNSVFKIKENSLTKEALYEATLPNGLTLVVIPKKGFTKQCAMYATDYGSNDIEFYPIGSNTPVKVPLGIAHFLEHKMFECESGQSVFELFAKYGSQPNAYTAADRTSYYFDSTDNFYENLHILIDYVNSPFFTDENVEKEKGIIAQEISMDDDDPQCVMYSSFMKAMYHNYPVKYDIAGDAESIKGITKDMLYLCYNNFYNPCNMILVVCGDLDPYEVYEKAAQFVLEDKRCLPTGKVRKVTYDEPDTVVKKYTELKMDISRPSVLFGWKDVAPACTGRELLKKKWAMKIAFELFGGKSSDAFSRLYNEQIIDELFSISYSASSDYAFGCMSAETDEYEKFITELKKEIALKKQQGFSQKEFDRIKKSFIGFAVSTFDSVHGLVSDTILLHQNNADVFDNYDILNSITRDDIEREFARAFDEEKCVVCIIKPTSAEKN